MVPERIRVIIQWLMKCRNDGWYVINSSIEFSQPVELHRNFGEPPEMLNVDR
jgi:hypothetical protein